MEPDPLFEILEGAHMRAIAAVLGEYFEALMNAGFARGESFALCVQWQHDYLGALGVDSIRARSRPSAGGTDPQGEADPT